MNELPPSSPPPEPTSRTDAGSTPPINEPSPARPAPARAASSASSSAGPGWERETLERLVFAQLREQRWTRRANLLLRSAWLLFLVVLAWAVFHHGEAGIAEVSAPHTAVVSIKGEIAAETNASSEKIIFFQIF